MKKQIMTLVLSLFSLGLFAQGKYLKDVTETQELSKKVVTLFNENKISASFDELTPYWPMPKNEFDAIEEKTIKYLNIIEQRFGKSIGTLKVKNETISEIAVRETYLIRYENTAIRLIFTYYKNNKGWIVNAFKLSTHLNGTIHLRKNLFEGAVEMQPALCYLGTNNQTTG